MSYSCSTFKSSAYITDLIDQNVAAVASDLNSKTSTLGLKGYSDNCEEYHSFVDELNKLYNKVESGDLSDFTELKL